jgi:hypothetical protein
MTTNLPFIVNGNSVPYENNGVEVTPGKIKRMPNPQVDGQLIITEDISTNFSTLKVTVRVTEESNKLFTGFYDNGTNNIITYGDKNYSACFLEDMPARKLQETVEYTFMGNPEV